MTSGQSTHNILKKSTLHEILGTLFGTLKRNTKFGRWGSILEQPNTLNGDYLMLSRSKHKNVPFIAEDLLLISHILTRQRVTIKRPQNATILHLFKSITATKTYDHTKKKRNLLRQK